MQAVQSTSLIRQSYEAYLRAGFALVPITSGKGPTHVGWSQRDQCWTSPEQIVDTAGVGIAHAYCSPVTCAFDIDDLERCRQLLAERGGNLDELFAAADSVTIDSGNPNHAKLLYTLPLPMVSKRITEVRDGVRTVIAELRCMSAGNTTMQDVLPSLAIHPKTGQHYRWGGNGHFSKLPMLPGLLLTWWAELLEGDTRHSLRMGEGVTPASMEEVRSALHAISPDSDRRTWIEIGMALEHVGEQSGDAQAAFDLWNEWSSGSPKYKAEEMVSQWKSFRPRKDGISVATLFHYARLAGWHRPAPDVSQLFQPVPERTRVEVDMVMSPKAWLPEHDIELWPEPLLSRAKEVAAEVGCDVTVPLMAGLSAVAGVVDKRISLRINPTWRVPPLLWLMTIGEPADKKTPGSKPMFAPLRTIEQEQRPSYEAEMLVWLGKEARYAAEAKAYREWSQSEHPPNETPPTVTPLPPEPVALRLLVTDSTSQKLVGMSQHRPRGFLGYMDEMANWLRRISDPRSTDDRGCWIQSYESGPYTMDRVGAGTISTDNLAMPIYGNCQPEVFREHGGKAASDGLLQRFLPVVLNSQKNAMWQEAVPEFMSSAGEYELLIRRLFALPVFEYVMDPEAFEDFRTFSQWALEFRGLERTQHESGTYQTALGKLEGNCARLILLFHLIVDGNCPIVSRTTVRRAVRLMHRFFVPMLRHVYMEVAEQRDKTGFLLFNNVLQMAGEKATVSLGELRRTMRYDSANGAMRLQDTNMHIRTLMEELTVMGYVSMHQDSPRNPIWAINPALAEMFKPDREKIIQRKQAAIDKIKTDIFARGGTSRAFPNAIGWRG